MSRSEQTILWYDFTRAIRNANAHQLRELILAPEQNKQVWAEKMTHLPDFTRK